MCRLPVDTPVRSYVLSSSVFLATHFGVLWGVERIPPPPPHASRAMSCQRDGCLRKSAHPISAAIVSKAVGCVGEAYELAQLPEVKKFRVLPGTELENPPAN